MLDCKIEFPCGEKSAAPSVCVAGGGVPAHQGSVLRQCGAAPFGFGQLTVVSAYFDIIIPQGQWECEQKPRKRMDRQLPNQIALGQCGVEYNQDFGRG